MKAKPASDADRTLLSHAERRTVGVRSGLTASHIVLSIGLVVAGLGPLLWLAKAAITPTKDTLTAPMAFFPNGVDWQNLVEIFTRVHIDQYLWNTLAVVVGSWIVQLLVATTGGYALSVLKPKYAGAIEALVLSTLFIPAVVLLVPLYLTVNEVPILGVSLINTFWAVWLPAGASAFNVVLMKRFFDNLPREIFEAAMVDGAGAFRLFWSIVLPMSKPILGVVSVFAVIAAWKDFLWPYLVLRDPDMQPLSVRLPAIAGQVQLDVFLASLGFATLIPIVLFLVFQRLFLRGAGLGGALKG